MLLSTQTRNMLLAVIGGAFVALCLASVYALSTLTDLRSYLDEDLQLTHQTLLDLSERTDRNEPLEDFKNIIRDCSNRAEFELLMSRLTSLSSAEHGRITQLFEECGDHYALIKRLSAETLAEIVREYEKTVITKGYLFTPHPQELESVDIWNRLSIAEKERADLMTEQVSLQRAIIDALAPQALDGRAIILEKSERAQVVGVQLLTLNEQIDTLRQEARSLEDSL